MVLLWCFCFGVGGVGFVVVLEVQVLLGCCSWGVGGAVVAVSVM